MHTLQPCHPSCQMASGSQSFVGVGVGVGLSIISEFVPFFSEERSCIIFNLSMTR